MSWVRLEPYEGERHKGCLTCGALHGSLALNLSPHPGFGGVRLTKDGSVVYPWGEDITMDEEREKIGQDYEDVAAGDPEHDWRLSVDAPLYDATYQRQGEGDWVLVHRGRGFA